MGTTEAKVLNNCRKNIDMMVVRLDHNKNDSGTWVYNEYELYLYINIDNITDELIKYIETYSDLKEYIVTSTDKFVSVFKSNGKQQGEPVELFKIPGMGTGFNNGKW